MELRAARRGPHSGRQFWGCSRYPSCKAVVDVDAQAPQAPALTALQFPTVSPPSFPVRFAAFARDRVGQAVFYQACGLPARLVEMLHEADIDHVQLRSMSQWRLDLPLPREDGIPGDYRSLVATAEAILTRGTTPLCSPSIEDALAEDLSDISDDTLHGLLDDLRYLARRPSSTFLPVIFESQEERAFFEWLAPRLDASSLSWTVVPQILLASLTPDLDPSTAQRGDFLLTAADSPPILVEIDGEHHKSHRDRDTFRDRVLERAGIQVFRIPTGEARRGYGPALDALDLRLAQARADARTESPRIRALRWFKFLHQMQLALLCALRSGWLPAGGTWKIAVLPPRPLVGDPRAPELVRLAVDNFTELLTRLARLQGRPLPDREVEVTTDPHLDPTATLLIGPADGTADNMALGAQCARLLVSDLAYPADFQAPLTAAEPVHSTSPSRDDARWFLRYLFRKEDFWEGQWETVSRALRGLDSVVLLPTGGGKSIAFQLAALLRPGRCIVVDPIISLIEDQIDNLARVGIDRCIGITSTLHAEERERALEAFQSGHYLFCYIAPERFQTIPFREALRALTASTPVSLIVIDEAHCVSEWGHDFRTAYLNLGRIAREYCTSHGVVPPLAALTGTASRIVLKDVQRELGIASVDAIITPSSFDRPELRFTVLRAPSSEKQDRVRGFLEGLPARFGVDRGRFFLPSGEHSYTGLVFCPHVNGPFGIIEYSERLREILRVPVGAYSGEAPRARDKDGWSTHKRAVARDFKRNRLTVLACTKAFGMGIDKPNIRYTVHIGLPPSIEAFYQEAGRAGRDRRPSECAVVLSNDDPRRATALLNPDASVDRIAEVVEAVSWEDADDVIRALWFHVRAFRGEESDVEDIEAILDQLGDIRRRAAVNVPWARNVATGARSDRRDDERERAEKALHRLVVLGVVQDYTVNYASGEFQVQLSGATQEEIAEAFARYAGAYQGLLADKVRQDVLALRSNDHRQFVRDAAKLLVRFIYDHIEKARRRALSEMLDAAARANTGEDLRRRILDYLERSEWDDLLDRARTSPLAGLDQISTVLDGLVSPRDAAALRGAVARMLGSYPDVPGLLLLRGAAEAFAPDANPDVVGGNIRAALRFAVEQYRIDPVALAQGVADAARVTYEKRGPARNLVAYAVTAPQADRIFVRELVRRLPSAIADIPARRLLYDLASRVAALCTM